VEVEIIAKCDRCHDKKLISLKKIENDGVRDLIKKYSPYTYRSIFGAWIIVCPNCVGAYEKIKEKRSKEAGDFMKNI